MITKWWFIAVGAWVSKNHTKVPAKNVKEDVADREDVILKASLKKQNKLAKKAVNPDIAKTAVSQGFAYAPKLYDMGTSKIGNKKMKKLFRSEMAKNLLNKRLDKAYSKL